MADKIFYAIGGTDNVVVTKFDPPQNPRDYDDVFKLSNCNHVLVEGITIHGGLENALDVVRGSDYNFKNCQILDGDVAVVTLKGSVDGFTFENCVFNGKLELGQFDIYWTPGRAPTRGGSIKNCNTANGGPIIVELWDATPPEVINSNVKFVKKSKFLWFPYFCWRYLVTKLT